MVVVAWWCLGWAGGWWLCWVGGYAALVLGLGWWLGWWWLDRVVKSSGGAGGSGASPGEHRNAQESPGSAGEPRKAQWG